MKLYGEITKVEPQEDGAIKVVGVASTGAVDDADERVLPEAMKAALPGYMRFGALREMHGLSAAGATLSAEVDENGATRIEALVVDPVAVRKVQLGVYKGFSIGGRVLARDPTDHKVITKLRLNEISLVDRPCNPEAVIDMWKADFARSEAVPSNAAVIARATAMAEMAGRPGRHTEYVVKAREALMQEAPQPDEDEIGAPDALIQVDTTPPIEALRDDFSAKIGARNSTADLAHIQAAHDHLVDLGACCDRTEADKSGASDDLIKVLAENARLSGDLSAMAPQLDVLRRTIETLEQRVEDLAAQPAAPKAIAGAMRAVTKTEDLDPGAPTPISADDLRKYFEALPEEERGRIQLRAALRQPFAIGL
jgi:hypothetical protein